MNNKNFFKFKEFSLDFTNCGMKLSTDAVILGSISSLKSHEVLDIGTGSGILSLMIAQRMKNIQHQITAIDIEPNAIAQATKNFKKNNWSKNITVIQKDVREYLKISNKKFDCIISNPPYYENSLKPANKKNVWAKHTETLSYNSLIHSIKELLSPSGIANLILPTNCLDRVMKLIDYHSLYLIEKIMIHSVHNKSANRVVLKLSNSYKELTKRLICIRDDKGYTYEFKELTKNFYLKF